MCWDLDHIQVLVMGNIHNQFSQKNLDLIGRLQLSLAGYHYHLSHTEVRGGDGTWAGNVREHLLD